MSQTPMHVSQTIERPKLIRLTMMPNLDVDDGKPTAAYVDPTTIQSLYRGMSAFHHYGTQNPQPAMNVTIVNCCHMALFVLETPEQVALMRELAFGQGPKPEAVR